MRVAVIFAGFFRTFEFVKQSLADHLLNPLDCDVFFSSPKTSFALPENEVPELHQKYSQNTNLVDVSWFGSRLKSFELVDHNAQFYKDICAQYTVPQFNHVYQHTWRVLSYMHAISRSVSVFRNYVTTNNLHYDLVIITRPDVKYYRQLDPHILDMSKVNFALHSMVGGQLGTCAANPSSSFLKPFNDQMVAGTQENMMIYHNIFDQSLLYHQNEGIIFNSETLWGVHCMKHGLDCIGMDFVLYELWRESKY